MKQLQNSVKEYFKIHVQKPVICLHTKVRNDNVREYIFPYQSIRKIKYLRKKFSGLVKDLYKGNFKILPERQTLLPDGKIYCNVNPQGMDFPLLCWLTYFKYQEHCLERIRHSVSTHWMNKCLKLSKNSMWPIEIQIGFIFVFWEKLTEMSTSTWAKIQVLRVTEGMENQNNQNASGGTINWYSLLKGPFVNIYQHSKCVYSFSNFSAGINSVDTLTHLCANTYERMSLVSLLENRFACKIHLNSGIVYSHP